MTIQPYPSSTDPSSTTQTPTGRRNGLGIAALVLGIAAVALAWTVFGGLLLGPTALILGILGYRRKRRGIATNGVMALFGAALGGAAVVASAAVLAVGVSLFQSKEFKTFTECLSHASTKSEQEKCEKDFDRTLPE